MQKKSSSFGRFQLPSNSMSMKNIQDGIQINFTKIVEENDEVDAA